MMMRCSGGGHGYVRGYVMFCAYAHFNRVPIAGKVKCNNVTKLKINVIF